MADTFKYAEMAEETPNAAQEFLKEQLSKNRYTKEQAERLDASGGATVGAGGEGFMKDIDMTDSSTVSPTSATSTWDGENYTRNSMNAEDLKNHFGLQDGSDVGSGFNASAGASDSDKTKGNALLGDGYLTNDQYEKLRNSEKVWKAYAAIEGKAAADEKRESNSDGLSINALDGLLDNLTAKKEEAQETTTEKPKGPIEYSDEIKQAVSRVRSYENDVLSGKTSQEIYGNNNNEENDNKYTFDMNKGIDGIGTEGGIIDSDTAAKSTENFLQSKKSDIMKKYQFKAA